MKLYFLLTILSFCFVAASSANMIQEPAAGDMTITVNSAERMRLTTGGNVGIGTAVPNAKLDVAGTISATNFVGNGSGLTNITATGSATDRISTTGVSSGATLGAVVANMGTVSFTLGGTAGAAYLHPTLGFVGPGVSTTGTISGTLGSFNSLRIGGYTFSVSCTNGSEMQSTHTAYTTSGNTIAASNDQASYEAWRGADNNNNTFTYGTSLPGWIKYTFANPTHLVGYYIMPRNGYTGADQHGPSNFLFQGSNDDSVWTTIDTRTSITFALNTAQTFGFSTDIKYKYYRLYITTTSSSGSYNYFALAEWRLYQGNCTLSGVSN